ncbi:MAG: hypothetical protein RMZ43_007230 [Nostoc sp. CmiVER01]|nr:hypothetical protein [Nostoc sp. CmiVER01]MDZ8125700.1 hypothetical protein [Nostoc sp. CmiVER01]
MRQAGGAEDAGEAGEEKKAYLNRIEAVVGCVNGSNAIYQGKM